MFGIAEVAILALWQPFTTRSNLTIKYDGCNIIGVMTLVPTKKELSHARIVDVAARAIRRSGYRGVGVADIMKEAGLTHGGFYAHFDSRDALVVEAMARAGQENLDALSDAIERRVRKGESRFRALVETYLHDAHMERSENGCVIAALASEMARQTDTVREEARQRVQAMIKLVRSTLHESTPPSAASVITVTMVGVLQMSRTLSGRAGRKILAQTRQALLELYDSSTHH